MADERPTNARLMIDLSFNTNEEHLNCSIDINGNLYLLTEMVKAMLKSRYDIKELFEEAINDLKNE